MIHNIQSLRALAATLVVLFHLVTTERNYGHGFRLMSDYWTIGMSGVDLFFVISGFIMVLITRNLPRQKHTSRQFLVHRFTRIFPLYWLFTLSMLAFFLFNPELLKRDIFNGEVGFLSTLFLLPDHGSPLLMVGWTLVHEIYFYLAFALLLLFPARLEPYGLALWAGFVIVVGLWSSPIQGAFWKLVLHPLTLEFISGCFVGRLVSKGVTGGGLLCLVTGILSWIVGYLIHVKLGLGLEPSNWNRILVFGFPSVLVVYGVVAIEIKQTMVFPNWSIILGDASYSTYLSHILVLGAMGRVGVNYDRFTNPDIRLLVLALLVLGVLTVGVATQRFIEVPLLRFVRSLIPRFKIESASIRA